MKMNKNKSGMRKKDINYVSLDSKSIITDAAFQAMSAEQRGVYLTLILYLYANGGSIAFDPHTLGRLCNCDNFENIWEKIKSRFKEKNKKISHKDVNKELARILKLSQVRSEAGVKGMKGRWNPDNKTITKDEVCYNEVKGSKAKRSEVKGSEVNSNRGGKPAKNVFSNFANNLEVKTGSIEKISGFNSSRIDSKELERKKMIFADLLHRELQFKGAANCATLRNFVNWLGSGIQSGKFDDKIWERVAKMAEESRVKDIINPRAFFMSKVKLLLGYKKNE